MSSNIIHDPHFLRETVVDVDAAVVGISSARWIDIPAAEADPERARQIMESRRFDILPIDDSGAVREYFTTAKWNHYSSITRHHITHRDIIPMRSRIAEVIKGFALQSRHFYFLGHERKVVGLVSVANLNCRQVNIYLFSLLCELETRLGEFITSQKIPESELSDIVFGDTTKEKHLMVKERYEAAKAAGLDIPFVEYVYLPDLIKILKRRNLYRKFGYSSAGQFDDAFNPLVVLRNSVAHPISVKERSATSLWAAVDSIEAALFELREA